MKSKVQKIANNTTEHSYYKTAKSLVRSVNCLRTYKVKMMIFRIIFLNREVIYIYILHTIIVFSYPYKSVYLTQNVEKLFNIKIVSGRRRPVKIV